MREEKKALRRTIRAKMRSEWTEEYRQTVSERVCQQIETFLPFVRSHCVALYCALPDEVDLTAILEHYQSEKRLLIPRVEGDDINFYTYQPESLITSEGYKILEPTAAVEEAVDPAEIELILVPGVAFDLHGGRMGRGKGYYDRFFARCPHALRAAVTSSLQIAEQIPLEPWDVAMHYIITDSRTYEVRD
ncbi:5-formyltetrahydrofolate cyclo-ligase [uncultured Porphyromonas sp.]|uniref:5-formyltetrahydrofolate cyclo-ligase n=1 Tax=uncultured Porphyromonas sp. TaxID=159274 RepID=UPI002805403C|nr:5-formyltetrahydrofolate cyclo-ligase [uncultured Porphyromonas sp.]